MIVGRRAGAPVLVRGHVPDETFFFSFFYGKHTWAHEPERVKKWPNRGVQITVGTREMAVPIGTLFFVFLCGDR